MPVVAWPRAPIVGRTLSVSVVTVVVPTVREIAPVTAVGGTLKRSSVDEGCENEGTDTLPIFSAVSSSRFVPVATTGLSAWYDAKSKLVMVGVALNAGPLGLGPPGVETIAFPVTEPAPIFPLSCVVET